jgi:exosortase D (VPLPA-CTERM-specific)
MTELTETSAPHKVVDPAPGGALAIALVVIAVAVAALLLVYRDGIALMVDRWGTDEYNHGPLIPVIALYLLWLRAKDISAADLRASWLGVAGVLFALAVMLLGNLSAVLTISQYGLILAVAALAVAATGMKGLKWLWVPLVYLIFMVPLPAFIENRLTAGLQLISSDLGVAVIRAAGYSVYLEGNVIDLGNYKLQVAEACSGMRYLFPLMSFGYLCAVLFRGRWWQRALIVLSTIPITILMNSFRIGVIGILVNNYGIEQAEGFIHDFEGWVVFMACVAILFLQIWVFARMEKRRFSEAFGLDIPPLSDLTALLGKARPALPVLASVAVLSVAAGLSFVVTRPEPVLPEREKLSMFPLAIGDWRGREGFVEDVYLDALKLSDYLIAYYGRPMDRAPVELWIAYYDTQVGGASVHSPKACLPGGGWQIEKMDEHTIANVGPDGEAMVVNRAVISLGDVSQVVYYWFDQRGRQITNEFAVKWYIFEDGLRMKRTDGALVRLSTMVDDRSELAAADARLEEFVRAIDPKLAYHLPGRDAQPRRLAMGGP